MEKIDYLRKILKLAKHLYKKIIYFITRVIWVRLHSSPKVTHRLAQPNQLTHAYVENVAVEVQILLGSLDVIPH